jgi:hypothetical protein
MHNEVLSDAEAQLIHIIRTSKDFTITIHTHGGRWDARLEDHDHGGFGTGIGSDFESAWDGIVDPRLRGQP